MSRTTFVKNNSGCFSGESINKACRQLEIVQPQERYLSRKGTQIYSVDDRLTSNLASSKAVVGAFGHFPEYSSICSYFLLSQRVTKATHNS